MRKETKKFTAFLKPIALLLVLVLLLAATSYAWVKRNWQPTIEQKGLTVSTGGSLAFKLSSGGSATTYFSINDQFPLYGDNFELQPLSSVSGDGSDFFNIDRSTGKPTFNKVFPTADTAYAFGYIEISFLIVSNEDDIYSDNSGKYTRFVYIDPESILQDTADFGSSSAADAIRISLTTMTNTSVVPQTILLWNRKEGTEEAKKAHVAVNPGLSESYNVDNPADPNNFAVHGKEVPIDKQFEFNEQLHRENDKIQPLDYYCGYQKTGDGSDLTVDKTQPDPEHRCLFSIAAGDTRSIILRIWLEGQDPNCTDQLAARQLDLKLIFNSYLYDNEAHKVVESVASGEAGD